MPSLPVAPFIVHARACLPRARALGWLLLAALLPGRLAAQTLSLPPGVVPCLTNDLPADYGTFVVLQSTLHAQATAGGDPQPTSQGARAVMELTTPPGLEFSEAEVTGPGGFRAVLDSTSPGIRAWSATYENEDRMRGTLVPGGWMTRLEVSFAGSRPFAGFFPFAIGASDAPPVPGFLGASALPGIDPRAGLELAWTPWAQAAEGDRLRLVVVDASGRTVFSAGTDCGAEVVLPATAGSVVLPAGRLPTQSRFDCYLTFGAEILASEDRSVRLLERGYVSRTTRLTFTTGGPLDLPDAVLSNPRISPDGLRLLLRIEGRPRTTYLVQWSSDLVDWQIRNAVTLPVSGVSEVSLPQGAEGEPRFWRARPLDPNATEAAAELRLDRVGQQPASLLVRGLPGYTYRLEASTDLKNWVRTGPGTVTIPATTNVVRTFLFTPPGTRFSAYRAVTGSAP